MSTCTQLGSEIIALAGAELTTKVKIIFWETSWKHPPHLSMRAGRRQISITVEGQIIDRLVYLTTIVEPLFSLPQAYQIYHDKVAVSVSILAWFGFMTLIWLWYGIVHKEKMIHILPRFILCRRRSRTDRGDPLRWQAVLVALVSTVSATAVLYCSGSFLWIDKTIANFD